MVHRVAGDGALWIGGLIRLMAAFGVSSQAVRQAVSRMTRQGWLIARREGNRAFYMVTARGRRRIEELSPRIYGPVIEWDGRWRLLSYAVGEAQRQGRERLRKELAALGWAQLSSSTWISPLDALAAAREAAETTVALGATDLFEAEYRGPHSDRELLERCWNVDSIAAAYREFVSRYRPRFDLEIAHRANCCRLIGPAPRRPRSFANTMRRLKGNHNVTFIFARALRTGPSIKASKRAAHAQTPDARSLRRRAGRRGLSRQQLHDSDPIIFARLPGPQSIHQDCARLSHDQWRAQVEDSGTGVDAEVDVEPSSRATFRDALDRPQRQGEVHRPQAGQNLLLGGHPNQGRVV
jgi:DNA-binding PadR family transcriptional regulator